MVKQVANALDIDGYIGVENSSTLHRNLFRHPYLAGIQFDNIDVSSSYNKIMRISIKVLFFIENHRQITEKINLLPPISQ